MASTEAQQEFDNLMRSKERRSRHPEDEHASEYGQERDTIDETSNGPAPRPSMSSTRDIVPRTKYGANTGPKGVISDAQNYHHSRRIHRTGRTSTSDAPTEPGLKFGQQLEMERLAGVEEHGDLEDDSDDMDDDFVAQWRQQRLQELQKGDYSSRMHDRSDNRNGFEGVTAVDGDGYLKAIEGSEATTVVVVYISDDASEVSQLFEECLRTLANKHQQTRFIKLDYQEAEIQAAGVPGIIAYRAGDKFAALIPVLDEMPDDGDLDAGTLEKVLQKHQILR